MQRKKTFLINPDNATWSLPWKIINDLEPDSLHIPFLFNSVLWNKIFHYLKPSPVFDLFSLFDHVTDAWWCQLAEIAAA